MGRAGQEPVEQATIDVLDHAHAGPAARHERRHHDDAGHEIVEVGPRRVESGDVGHAAEQRAEQEQPDDRLDEGHGHEPRLPQQLAGVALGHEVGLRDGGHAKDSSVCRKDRPVWRR